MALDGILLNKLIPEISKSFPLRIQKIWDISNTEILFQTHGHLGKQQLLISCHSVYNRILFTNRSYSTNSEPKTFVMLLRKYLEGATMESIEQENLDRWCLIKIKRHNNLGDIEYLKLYIELMGKYANIILVNQDNKIIDALKRIPPSENNLRTIHPGATFPIMPKQDKRNPFIDNTINKQESLTKQFAGFSPFLSKEVEYRMQKGEQFIEILNEIKSSNSLYIASQNNEPVFHCIELKSCGKNKVYPLFEGFELLYYHKEEKERIKQITGDISKFSKRQLKHYKQKYIRLTEEFEEAKNCEIYKKYGELLYMYNVEDTKGKLSITLHDYETDADVEVPLDPKLDGKRNAKKAFQKYNKRKKGQIHLQEQLLICEQEIDYFTGILEQLDQADFHCALEIKEELIQQGYLKDNPKRKKKNAKQKTNITTITLPNKTEISFGKNNLQNDDLTWHIAKRNEIWMHAKDYHGSHVIIHNDSPSEEELRYGAMIAAYYSQGRLSSSVPVDYCPIRNLKKISGAKPGMVQLGSYKTIYIDPDEDIIEKIIS